MLAGVTRSSLRQIFVGLLLAIAFAGDARSADAPLQRWQGRTMGSPYTVQIVGAHPTSESLDALKAEVETRLKEINRQMSHYDPESELSRFNRAPAHQPFPVSPEFARVVRFALDLARRSGGAFDPTLGPVINLWGFGEKSTPGAVPSDSDLKAALARTGFHHLAVTPRDELVKDIPDLALNLSAVAKGFGVDELVRLLHRRGHTNVYVAIAGEVRTSGHNARGTAWQVGIVEPLADWREGDPMAEIAALSDRAISTSGDYQKFFRDAAGRRFAHIFDPRTGRPVQHRVGGVSVVAPDSMTADALATTLFVLGEKDGLAFVESWAAAGALFIVRQSEEEYRLVRSRRFAELAGLPP